VSPETPVGSRRSGYGNMGPAEFSPYRFRAILVPQ
jgi:hypothetical protein